MLHMGISPFFSDCLAESLFIIVNITIAVFLTALSHLTLASRINTTYLLRNLCGNKKYTNDALDLNEEWLYS